MSIIGIVASERQTNQIKKQINSENVKTELISINPKSIENIKNIKFEIIVIQESLDKLKNNQLKMIELLRNAKYLLLNADITKNEELFQNINAKILTYGLKQKSTITTSSIEENQVIVSIQRAFESFDGKIIEQQEVPVELIKNGTKDLYNSLIKIAIINICAAKNR